MNAFEMRDVFEQQRRSDKRYLEFLRVPALSAGLYVLPASATDTQSPHTEDEIYYVLRGRGMIRVEAEDRAVEPGSFVYVKARDEHRFHSITEELTLLVVFAPAEYSQSGA